MSQRYKKKDRTTEIKLQVQVKQFTSNLSYCSAKLDPGQNTELFSCRANKNKNSTDIAESFLVLFSFSLVLLKFVRDPTIILTTMIKRPLRTQVQSWLSSWLLVCRTEPRGLQGHNMSRTPRGAKQHADLWCHAPSLGVSLCCCPTGSQAYDVSLCLTSSCSSFNIRRHTGWRLLNIVAYSFLRKLWYYFWNMLNMMIKM